MKFIRKYFKQILCLAVIALFAVLFAFNPTIATIAEGVYAVQSIETALESINMPISVVDLSKGDTFSIPLISSLASKDYFIRVIDPIGQTHDCKVTSGSITENDYFRKTADAVTVKSLNNGIYKVVYFYYDSTNKKFNYSYPYEVEVKSVSYELDFIAENGKKVLVPSSANDKQEIILPNAFVKIKGTDDYKTEGGDTKLVVTPVVVKNGATIFDLSQEKSSTEVQLIESEDENNGRYKLITNLGEDEFATYVIKYRYLGGSDIPTKNYTINVSKDFEAPKTLEIDKKEMPKNIELGKRNIELPEISAHTEYSEDVDYNITEIKIEKEDNKNIYQVLTNNDRTFDMTLDAFTFANGEEKSYANMIKNNSYYKITYKIESYYGLTAEKSFLISGVADNTKPTVYMAYSYDLEGGDWEVGADGIPTLKPTVEGAKVDAKAEKDGEDVKVDEDGYTVYDVNTDYDVELKSSYGFGELVFPAIYAQDLVNTYDEFTFIRYFENKNNSYEKYYIDNIKLDEDNNIVKVSDEEDGFNASGDTNIGHFNRVVRFKFKDKSQVVDSKTYRLRYYVIANKNYVSKTVQEGNLYETGSTYYEFKILNRAQLGSAAKNEDGTPISGVSTPTIAIDDLKNESSISKNSELTLTVTAKDEYDTRLKNAMFYYTNKTSENTVEKDVTDALNTLILKGVWDSDDNTPELTETDFTNFKANVLDTNEFVEAMAGKGYTNFKVIKANENKSFDLKLNLTDGTEVNLVAIALNDNNNIAVATKKLVVNNTTEKTAPASQTAIAATNDEDKNPLASLADRKDGDTKFALNLTKEESFGQGDKIYLPTIKFKDAEDKSLSAFVKYYILNDDKLTELNKLADPEKADSVKIPEIRYLNPSKVNYSYEEDGTTSINGGYITASSTGTYYVLYTAIDDAGNQTFLTYSFKVIDTVAPTLTVNVKGANKSNDEGKIAADINTILTFEPTLTSSEGKDLTDDANSKYEIKIVGTKYGNSPQLAGSGKYAYKFDTPDTYSVTISATHKYTDEGAIVRESNQVHFDVNITVPDIEWSSDIDIQPQAEIGETIYLPYITAQHGTTGIMGEVEVHVKDPDNKTPEHGDAKVVNIDGTNYWEFTFNDNTNEEKVNYTTRGTYRVTYTAVSEYGTATPKTFDIKVGDSIAPTFSIASDKMATLRQDIIYDGTNPIEYSIDLVRYSTRTLKIIVSSNGKEIYNVDTGLQIFDKNGTSTAAQPFLNWSNLSVELKTQDGSLVENTDTELEKQYTINGVGKYTLVLTMTDNNNNTTTKNIDFNVVSKSEAKNVNDNVAGIVLIVVSLVILAGVILFFTFTGKKGGKGSNNRRLNSTKNSKKENENKVENKENVEAEGEAKTGEVE